MPIEANDLLLFARVAEAGSFSRAAERVRLPKSTVSRRIAALERQLGERLLQRTTRKLSVTDFGQGVLDHALFGSTTERVVRKAPCPVLICRLAEHEFVAEK